MTTTEDRTPRHVAVLLAYEGGRVVGDDPVIEKIVAGFDVLPISTAATVVVGRPRESSTRKWTVFVVIPGHRLWWGSFPMERLPATGVSVVEFLRGTYT